MLPGMDRIRGGLAPGNDITLVNLGKLIGAPQTYYMLVANAVFLRQRDKVGGGIL